MHLLSPRQCLCKELSGTVGSFLFYPSSSWNTVLRQGEERHSGPRESAPGEHLSPLRGARQRDSLTPPAESVHFSE